MAESVRPYIFMNLWGRCGAIFFHSLFDNHPDLSTIPGIGPYNLLAEYLRKPPVATDPITVAKWIATVFNNYFNNDFFRNETGLDRLGLNGDEKAAVDIQRFFEFALADQRQRNDTSLFGIAETLHNAWDRVLGRAAPLPMVFLQLHKMAIEASPNIVAALPENRRGVLLARAPIDTAESNLNYMINRPPIQRNRLSKMYVVSGGMLDYQYGPAFLDYRAITVRLEDLKKAPEDFMRRLSDFLGLRFDDSLLQTTQMGRYWKTLPTRRNPQIKDFVAPSSNPEGYRLTPRDRSLFAALYDGMRRFMDYPVEAELASEKELQEIVSGAPFDWEIMMAEVIGFDPRTLPQQPDYIGFRRTLAAHMARPRWQDSHLKTERLILA